MKIRRTDNGTADLLKLISINKQQGKGENHKNTEGDAQHANDAVLPVHFGLVVGLIRFQIGDEGLVFRKPVLVFGLLRCQLIAQDLILLPQGCNLDILFLQLGVCHRHGRGDEAEQGIHGQTEKATKRRNFVNAGLFMLTGIKTLDGIHGNAGGVGDFLVGYIFPVFFISHNREQGSAIGLEVV